MNRKKMFRRSFKKTKTKVGNYQQVDLLYEQLIQAACSIANKISDFSKKDHEHIALLIRDELSNLNFKRATIVKAWENGDIHRLSKNCVQRLIAERNEIIKKQREDYYVNGPAQKISEEDDKVIVKYGRVEKVEERRFEFFCPKGIVDWTSYNEHRLSSGKKCQVITIANDNREFRVVFSNYAKGVEVLDVIDFEGVVSGNYVNILKSSNIKGIGIFNVANPITVNKIWYPSIAAAYAMTQPILSYGYITKLIRDGIEPDEAFRRARKNFNPQLHAKIKKTFK